MKCIKYTVLLAIITCATVTSCQKYLDVKKNSQQLFIETAEDCQQLLDNYGDFSVSGMNNAYPSDGEASADEYYFTANRYNQLDQESKNITTWKSDAQRTLAMIQWRNPYKIVYYANLVLDNIDKVKGTADETTINSLKGSALFFRSFTFWTIAQLYASPYIPNGANEDPGIPLRLTSDLNDLPGRGTVQQTYSRIVDDLKLAVALMPVTSALPSRPNKVAAYAMLARVYLSMEDYENALFNANAAMQLKNSLLDYNNVSTTSPTPFARFNDEVIFQAIMGTSPAATLNLLFPGSSFQQGAFINKDLYSSYTVNDLRKRIFFKANSAPFEDTYRFSGNYEPTTGAGLFTGLAVDELYLTRAECYARLGQLTDAVKDLNTLLAKRWESGTYVDLNIANPDMDTQDEVLAKVLLERRKELLMRGLRWTDLRRLNRDSKFRQNIERKLVTGLPPEAVTTTIATLPANDPRYVLLIPAEVINAANTEQNKR